MIRRSIMRKRYLIPTLVLAGCIFATGCGSSNEQYNLTKAADMYYDGFDNNYSRSVVMPSADMAMEAEYKESGGNYQDKSQLAQSQDIVSRKVIKTATLDVQTRTFDDFVNRLMAKIDEFGCYMQDADVSGNNLYQNSERRATYTIRVPEDKINPLMDSIGEFGTVTNSKYNETDVTLDYVDIESRIKTLTTEQETLLGLLEKAAYLEDIIRLEERLSEVNFQLESYKSRQRTYDNKISFSTLTVYVREVERIATVKEEPKTLGQRIVTGFKDNMLNIWDGIQAFIVWFLSYIVNIIVVCGLGALVVFFIIKKYKKVNAARAAYKASNKTDETEMGNNK